MGENKRKYDRVSEQILTYFRIIALADAPYHNLKFSGLADLENISEGGLLFQNDDFIPVGTFLELGFHIKEKSDPLFLKGRIMHLKKLANNRFSLGVQFLSSFEEDKSVLIDFLRSKGIHPEKFVDKSL